MNSIDLKFAKSVLLKLYEEGNSLKTNLQVIVKNLYSLDKLIQALKEDGLVSVDTKSFGKNIQEISLTIKGLIVAENLKHIEEPRVTIQFNEKYGVILKLLESGSSTLRELAEYDKNAPDILRDLEKVKLVKQEINKNMYPPKSYIFLTDKGRDVAKNLSRIERKMIAIPEGIYSEVEKIVGIDKSHASVEEYANEAIRKTIEKWKREHAVG